MEQTHDPDVIYVVTVRDGDIVHVWQRAGEGCTRAEFAEKLQRVVDGFKGDDVRRIS